MRKRTWVIAPFALLALWGAWWLARPDTGAPPVERPIQVAAAPAVGPAGEPEPIVRGAARRRPPREDRPVVPEVPEAELADGGPVLCPVEGAPEGTPGFLMLEGDRGRGIQVIDEGLWVNVPPGVRRGRVVLDGYGAVDITLYPGTPEAPGHCGGPLRFDVGPAVLIGMVTHADGRPAGKVWVQGCGRRVLTDVDGSYYLEARFAGTCRIQAFRQDGVFTIWSEPVEVAPVAGEDTVANLELPPYETAGLGAEVRDVDDGILILRTLEGGSARLAGLDAGDVVLEIDGIPTTELSLREFVERALGPEGTAVELVVAEGDGERIIELERRTIARDEG